MKGLIKMILFLWVIQFVAIAFMVPMDYSPMPEQPPIRW